MEQLRKKMTPIASWLSASHMERLGIRNTRRIANLYNRLHRGRSDRFRRKQFRDHFEALIAENGALHAPPVVMKDGWALDISGELPWLEELIAESEEIIRERGLVPARKADAYRAFLQNLALPEDAEKYPSLLNFALSSEVLTTICQYMGLIPVLSGTLPIGVRLAESSVSYADRPTDYRDSQLFHMDYYSSPTVYVIVLVREVTSESGPFRWVSASESARAAQRLRYWSRGKPYRLSDEEFYAVVDPKAVHELCYPKGTVLFVDPSRCFHYGSRNAIRPRYQMMYGFAPVCRCDLSELVMTPVRYKVQSGDSRLRKMILRNDYMPL